MATITQTIPSYNGGISQQPDELKVPGQVKDALNVLPDLTHGLLKRPGGKLVASLSDNSTSALNSVETGKWFHYYRDETEQYIGQIKLSDGTVRVWRCSDGAAMTVQYGGKPWAVSKEYSEGDTTQANSNVYKCVTAGTSASSGSGPSGTGSSITDNTVTWDFVDTLSNITTQLKNYLRTQLDANGKETLSGGTIIDSDIQSLTLNDFTYLVNRNKTAAMASTVEPTRPAEAYIELKKVAYASQYSVNLYDSTTTTSTFTATRIRVDRNWDSSNGCASGGALPAAGNLPDDGNRCTAGNTRDSLCPNVATEIFAVNHNDAGNAADANNTAHTYSVTLGQSSNYGAAADRKNLYFRITTTGQAVPTDGSSPTYHCRYTTTHDLLYGGEGWRTGDNFQVWMNNASYTITIDEHSESQVQATMDSNDNSGLIRPIPTPFDTETTITSESIIGDIRSAIISQNNGLINTEVTQIGNGLYITDGAAFNVSTPVSELLNVFTDSIEDVADLPRQCKHGYVVRVANSAADEDDYYLKFFGNNNRDGEGVWEECPEPGRKIEFDKATMPIQMVRESDQTFTVKHITWDQCPVGDTTTVPEPSFIGSNITKMLFWRNRLALLSNEDINLSRPGSFFNFWPKTAITYTATDNIDISCSSEYPAIIYDGIQVNQGLVLFTKNQQFMLTTDSDVLSPQTAKINSVSTYNFNYNVNPVSLGTTVGFLDNGGKNTRFFEMSNVVREGAPDVIEQSKIVSRLFPKGISLIANSRENSVILFAEKGKDELFGYRYFSSIEKRVQNAWFRWKLSGTIQHMAMLDDSLYVIVRNNGKDVMQRFTIKLDDATTTLVDDRGTTTEDDDITYRLHLDNATTIAFANLTYHTSGTHKGYTTFDLPDGFNNTFGDLHAIMIPTTSDKTGQGMSAPAYTTKVGTTNSVRILGDWVEYDPQMLKDSDTSDDVDFKGNIILGYTFDMEVKFPTVYYVRQIGDGYRSEHQGSLTLHRLKFSFGPVGVYETVLDRVGKRTYTDLHEATIADDYISNRVQFREDKFRTIPVYERNTNVDITLKSTHPSPATLFSMTWEGEYNNRYYKRV